MTVVSNNNSKPAGVLSIDPQKLHLIAPALELTQGSAIPSSNDSSAVLLGNDIAISHLTGKTMPFALIGQKVKVKYSILDPNTGILEEQSKEFVVKGIMQPVGNPTIGLSLFLVEALIIGLLGAVIGSLVGVGGGYALVTNFTSSSSTHEWLV